MQQRLNFVGSYTIGDPAVTPDTTTGQSSLATAFTGEWAATSKPLVKAWYDAQRIPIGSLYYAWKKNGNVDSGNANWGWDALLSTDDLQTSTNTTANLRAAGPGTGTLSASAATNPPAACSPPACRSRWACSTPPA